MKSQLFSLMFLAVAALTATAQAPASETPPAAATQLLTLGLVVDNSGSYRTIFDRVVTSTNAVIDDVRPGDEGFFVTFIDAPKTVLRQEITREKRDLRDASDSMYIQGGQTSVIDAVIFAAKYLAQQGASDADRSRVIVLITDGDDRGSVGTVDEAVKFAKDARARIFVLGLYEEKFYPKVVDRLIKETGGAKFVPKMPKETAAAVSNLLAAIRSK